MKILKSQSKNEKDNSNNVDLFVNNTLC